MKRFILAMLVCSGLLATGVLPSRIAIAADAPKKPDDPKHDHKPTEKEEHKGEKMTRATLHFGRLHHRASPHSDR